MRDKCFKQSNYCPLKKPYSDTHLVGLLVGPQPFAFCFNCLFNIPVSLKPTYNRVIVNAINTGPICDGLANSINFIKLVSGIIVSLLLLGRPSAVIGRIIFIVINSVERVFFRRSFTQVFHKIDIAVFTQPSFADLNSSPTVTMISPKSRLITSVSHRMIRTICKLTINRPTVFVATIILPLISTLYATFSRIIVELVLVASKRMTTLTQDRICFSVGANNSQNTLRYHASIIAFNRGKIKE